VLTVLAAAGWRSGLRSALAAVAGVVTVATSPHLGQAPETPSNEYKQPQKQATSAITAPVRSAALPVWSVQPGRWTGDCLRRFH
jgi:hypothetical protein